MSRHDLDITERLRWDKRYTNGHVSVTLEDAAKEIERLRSLAHAKGESVERGTIAEAGIVAERARVLWASKPTQTPDLGREAAIEAIFKASRERFERDLGFAFDLKRAEYGDGYFHDGISAMWSGWERAFRHLQIALSAAPGEAVGRGEDWRRYGTKHAYPVFTHDR